MKKKREPTYLQIYISRLSLQQEKSEMFLLALSYLSVRWFSILHTCHFFLCIHFYEGAQIYNNYEVCQTAFHTPGHGLTEKGSSQTDLREKNRVRHVWEMMYSERCMLDTDVKKVFCSRNGEGWKKRFSCSLSLSLFFSLKKSGFLQEVHRNLMAVAAQWFAALCLQKLKHIYTRICARRRQRTYRLDMQSAALTMFRR